jgi:hypothetical protein
MAMPRTSGLDAYPSAYPSPAPDYHRVRELLTTEELLIQNKTKIRAVWRSILESWFPSMKKLDNPTLLDILSHSFAVIGETAYFSYLIDLVVKLFTSDFGRGFMATLGGGFAVLLYKFAEKPELGKKLFMDMIGLIVVMVQLSLTPYTSAVGYIENRLYGSSGGEPPTPDAEIDDKKIVEKVVQAGAVVAGQPPEEIPKILDTVVRQTRDGEPNAKIARDLIKKLSIPFHEQNLLAFSGEPFDLQVLRLAEQNRAARNEEYDLRASLLNT